MTNGIAGARSPVVMDEAPTFASANMTTTKAQAHSIPVKATTTHDLLVGIEDSIFSRIIKNRGDSTCVEKGEELGECTKLPEKRWY